MVQVILGNLRIFTGPSLPDISSGGATEWKAPENKTYSSRWRGGINTGDVGSLKSWLVSRDGGFWYDWFWWRKYHPHSQCGEEGHTAPHLRFNTESDVDTCRQSNHRARKKNRVLSAMSARNGVSTSNCFSTLDDQIDDDTDKCNNHTDITKASYTIVISIFGRLDTTCPP